MPANSPYPQFSTGEFQRRHTAVRALMQQQNVEALLIRGGPGGAGDIHYLSNYYPFSPCWLFFPQTGEPVIFHHFFNHGDCTRAMTFVDDVRWYGAQAVPTLAQFLQERALNRGRIGVVGLQSTIPYGQFMALQKALPEAQFQDVGRAYSQLRWVRSAEELTWVRESAYRTDVCCEMLERGIRPGRTEHDVTLMLYQGFIPHGGQIVLQFLTSTPMTEPQRRSPWQYPTNRVLQPGDAVITELSVSYWGYATQVHRPFAVGSAPTPVYWELFDAAHACYERVRLALVPGATSEQIIAAGGVIEERGFTSYDSLVHGEMGKNPELGTPSAAHPLEPFTFQENMVVVIQPNPTTKDGTAGLQLGATVVVKPGGGEQLNHYPFKFPVCG